MVPVPGVGGGVAAAAILLYRGIRLLDAPQLDPCAGDPVWHQCCVHNGANLSERSFPHASPGAYASPLRRSEIRTLAILYGISVVSFMIRSQPTFGGVEA